MNIKMPYLAVIAAGMLITVTASAQDEDKLSLVGAGWTSCGEFLEHSEKAEEMTFLYTSWMQGFLSALNLKHVDSDNATDLSDRAAQSAWIENFCREQPLQKYFLAVTMLWHQLRIMQGLDPDSPVPIQ